MKKTNQDGSFTQTFHAIFRMDRLTGAETKLTRWDRRKDKVISKFRRSSHHGHGGTIIIRTKAFFTPARLVEA
jgi:uncharacterized protein (UPF0303 family)